MTRRILVFLTLLGIVCLSLPALCQTRTFHDIIPAVPSSPALVHDYASMLSSVERQELEAKLYQFERETSNELAVVIVDTLGYMEISEFANELGRKWSIGKASKRNGILLLISKKDRQLNISPADRLQGALPDATCGKIIRSVIVPEFRAGNYYQGITAGVEAIMAATRGEFTADEAKESPADLVVFLLIMVLFIVILLFIIFRKNKQVYVSRRGYKYDDWNNGGGGWFGGGSSWGGGSWGGGSSGGGGFGGFGGGGGGFDGGGASGSW